MINYKKIVLGSIIIGLFLGLFNQNTFAQNTNPLCSTSLRGVSPSHKPQDLYKPDGLKIAYMLATKSISSSDVLNQSSINGNIARHNNFSNCNPDNPTSNEKSAWESRRINYKNLPSVNVSIVNNNVSLTDGKKLQQFINTSCALTLTEDGKIGIKTLNSILYCKPAAKGYMSWTDFQSLYTKLYLDENGTNKLRDGSKYLGDPSGKLYIKQVDLGTQKVSDGLGLVKETLPITGSNASTGNSITGGLSSTCRFAEPKDKDSSERKIYQAALQDTEHYIQPEDACKNGCGPNAKEVMKGGSSVCEICDIEKCNCGIKLNTYVPFIGRCIVNKQDNNSSLSGGVTTVNSLNAFPILMGALIKLLMSIIMILCFASLIVGGFMMTIPDQYETGKGLVKKVVWTIVALGSLGTILYLINPNFFT